MLLTQMPGYTKPTVAIFPFRWYEVDRWIIRAFKYHPDGTLKWMQHFIERDGHAACEAYDTFDEAHEAVYVFNESIRSKTREFVLDEELQNSIALKAEKEITAQERLTKEEWLMLQEALRRNASLPRPNFEDILLPKNLETLRPLLLTKLTEAPYIQIAHFSKYRVTLARSGDHD